MRKQDAPSQAEPTASHVESWRPHTRARKRFGAFTLLVVGIGGALGTVVLGLVLDTDPSSPSHLATKVLAAFATMGLIGICWYEALRGQCDRAVRRAFEEDAVRGNRRLGQ